MYKSYHLIGTLILTLLISCAQEGALSPDYQTNTLDADNYVPGKARIKISEELAEDLETGDLTLMDGATIRRSFSHGGRYEERMRRAGLHLWYDIDFAASTPLTRASEELMHLDGVDIVEFVPVISSSSSTPVFNDPDLRKQWHYINNGNVLTGRVAGCDINVEAAWKRGVVGSDKVIVAVIDGGVDSSHEDLKDNMWTGTDGNGKAIHGYNFALGSYRIVPDDHGTHVAGTVAAVNNNGIGCCGVAGGDAAKGIKGAGIMSCQIFDGDIQGNEADAIVWAANNGAVIAQNSWGYDLEHNPDMKDTPRIIKEAIDYFNEFAGCDENGNQLPDSPMKGGAVFFASGNEAKAKGYPASYEGCIAVSAVNGDFHLAPYSNYGDWVDIAAPGGEEMRNNLIYSTLIGNRYDGYQGTSMACPHVSGVAALVVSEFGGPGFTREDLIDRLLRTASDISLPETEMGAGMVNASAATAHYGEYLPNVPSFAKSEVLSGTEVRLKFIMPEGNNGVECSRAELFYGTEAFTEAGGNILSISESTRKLHEGDTLVFTVAGLSLNTEYYFSVRGYDAYDNASQLSESQKITTYENLPPEIIANDGTDFTFKQYMNPRISFRVSDPENALKEVKYVNATEHDRMSVNDGIYTVMIEAKNIKAGSYESKIIAEDSHGETAECVIRFVIEENQDPVQSAQMENVLFTSRTKTQTIDMSGYFSDEDGEELKYTATSSDEAVVKTSVAKNSLTLRCSGFGQAEITVKAEDALGKYVQSSFRIVARDGSVPYDLYPNPVTDGRLHIRSSKAEEVKTVISGASGAIVHESSIVPDPFNPAVVDLSGLMSGVYNVKVTDNSGKEFTQNIVKL